MAIRDESGVPKRGPGRPRKQPPSVAPLFTDRDGLAHLIGVSRRLTYDLERDDPDFPVGVTIGNQTKFGTADAERYAALKIKRAREERRAKAKQRDTETAA